MPAQDAQRLRDIFLRVVGLPPAQRTGAVADACAGRPELREGVERLLGAHDRAGEFLSVPTFDTNMPRPCSPGSRSADPCEPAPDPADRDAEPVTEGAGSSIGRYRLVRQIGEGGFGVVFLAEQSVPVRRPVALKVIKLGMDTRQVVARFEAERQALALMDHPNIAKVLDGGATASGRPFFVMDLVAGVPITHYCDARALTPRQRVELLLPVCDAVQHAHQKGIIHRDLKPGNVLVAEADDKRAGKALPKVIDFGIAKATTQPLTDRTLFTGSGQWVGTPQYMSPEQAAGDGSDVDTRSDVYSLGVLLYELLTGTTPIEIEALRATPVDRVRQAVRDSDPPVPSSRLSSRGPALPEAAARRGLEPGKLLRAVRGELDWIVMRALEKDRARRYETAAALADDLRRFLAGEPVQAAPPTAAYRLRKFASRNRGLLAAGGTVAAALLLGLGLSLAGFVRAAAERDHARQEAARFQAVDSFLQQMLGAVDPDTSRGGPVSVRQVLDESARQLDQGRLRDQPLLGATLHSTVGRMYLRLGLDRAAEHHLRLALETRRRLLGEYDAEVAQSLFELGGVSQFRRDAETSETLYRKALALSRRIAPDDPRVGQELTQFAMVLGWRDKLDEADAALDEALRIARRTDPRGEEVARGLDVRAELRLKRGDYDGAVAGYNESLQLFRGLPAGECTELAMVLHDLGGALWFKGDYRAAEAPLREAYDIARRLLGEGHTQTGRIARSVARVLRTLGRGEEAEAFEKLHARQRLTELTRELEAHAPEPILLRARGEALLEQGDANGAMGEFDAALRLDRDDPDALADRAALLARQDRVDDALADYNHSLALLPNNADRLAARAEVFERRGRFAEARADFQRALELSPWDYQWRTNLAALELLFGRRDRFREHCAFVVKYQHDQQWPIEVVDRTVRTCQLDSDPVPVSPRNRRTFDFEVGVPADRSSYSPWVWETKGLMEYRAGRYHEAISWLAKAREPLGFPAVRMTIDLLTELSRLRAAPVPENREELARLVAQSKATAETQDPGPFTFDLVILNIIRREAEDLLRNPEDLLHNPQATPAAPPQAPPVTPPAAAASPVR